MELGEPKVYERSAYGGEAIGWTCIRMGFIASWQKQKWANNKPVHLSPHLHTHYYWAQGRKNSSEDL